MRRDGRKGRRRENDSRLRTEPGRPGGGGEEEEEEEGEIFEGEREERRERERR